MRAQLNSEERVASEELILRALCGGALQHAVRRKAMALLAQYSWQEGEHRVIFEALEKIGSRDPESIRAHLAAAVTRLGFPDVALGSYLAPGKLPGRDWLALVRALVSAPPRNK